MTTVDGRRGPVSCPECGSGAPVSASLCPACGYPLVLAAPSPTGAPVPLDLLRKPGERPGPSPRPGAALPTVRVPTRVPPRTLPTGQAGPVGQTGQLCPTCGFVSATTRIRCERCGGLLRNEVATPAELPVLPGPPRRRGRRLLAILFAALAALGLIGAGTYLGVRLSRPNSPAHTVPRAGVTRPAAPGLVPIDPRTVHATATSTLTPVQYYRVANTLDGRLDTAWNSDGRSGTGAGVRLRYTFAGPVHLGRIAIRNGFVSSHYDADVWQHNGRLHQVRVITAAGSRLWTVPDRPDLQVLQAELGTTDFVELDVVSVYPGTKFRDLALTEIQFARYP